MPTPIPKKISQILPTFQNVAQSSHYLVNFGLPGGGIRDYLRRKGVDDRFDLREIGLLCSAAVLPGSSFATTNAIGEYQGVIEKVPHTKTFIQMQLEFYVDNEYKSLKFLEHWMEYISGGSEADSTKDAYHFRMNYPNSYKSNTTTVTKFEKNYRQSIEYEFRGLYPLDLTSVRVAYQNSQVLKATAAFHYDRYICGKTKTWDKERGMDRNNMSTNKSSYLDKNRSNWKTSDADLGLTKPGTFTELLNANAPGNKELMSYAQNLKTYDSDGGWFNKNI